MYYITRGVLQENRQELVVFVLSVLVVMLRSVANFSVLPTYEPLLTVRHRHAVLQLCTTKLQDSLSFKL